VKNVSIKFLGAASTVTGSKYLLQTPNFNVMIDCGLFQGLKELRLKNWDHLPLDPGKIDAVIITHAHLDHTGYLPVLKMDLMEIFICLNLLLRLPKLF
jgi:metallo-beta-lactamase family protein